MTYWEKVGYKENINRLQAKRTRLQFMTSSRGLTPKGVYQITLAETEDYAQAEKAEMKMIASMLRNGQTPDID